MADSDIDSQYHTISRKKESAEAITLFFIR